MDSPAIHQSRNYFKIPRGVQTGLEQCMGGGGGAVEEKTRNFPFMLLTSQPCSPFRVSSQGMKSGKDSQIPRPVGALIKLLGSHSRIYMVSETVSCSLHFCLLFCFEGQRVDFTHFSSHHCGEATTSSVSRVSVPLKQERTDWELSLCRCPAVPHLLPVCALFKLAESAFPRLNPNSWYYS